MGWNKEKMALLEKYIGGEGNLDGVISSLIINEKITPSK